MRKEVKKGGSEGGREVGKERWRNGRRAGGKER